MFSFSIFSTCFKDKFPTCDSQPACASSRCAEDRAAQSQRQLFHIKSVGLKEKEKDEDEEEEEGKIRKETKTKEEETCLNGNENEDLALDPHVVIRYHRGLVQTGQPVRASVNLRANFSAELVVVR